MIYAVVDHDEVMNLEMTLEMNAPWWVVVLPAYAFHLVVCCKGGCSYG